MEKMKTSLDGALDNTGPAILVLYEPIWTSLNLLKEKGIKILWCHRSHRQKIFSTVKNILKIGDFRHLEWE